MIRSAWYAFLVLSTLLIIVLLWQFRVALVLFALSLALAATIRPLIKSLTGQGLSQTLSLLTAYLLACLTVIGVLALITIPVMNDLQLLVDKLSVTYERVANSWPHTGTLFQQMIANQLPSTDNLFDALQGERGVEIAQNFLGILTNLFGFIGVFGIALVVSIYWSSDRVYFERLWLSLISGVQRAHALQVWRSIESGVGSYIRYKFVQSLVGLLVLWVAFYLIGLPYPALLATSGAFFGSFLSLVLS